MAKAPRSTGLLVLLLVIGGILGTLLGHFLGDYISFLDFGSSIGMETTTIDLLAIQLTLGVSLHLNISAIIGFFLALFIYFRL